MLRLNGCSLIIQCMTLVQALTNSPGESRHTSTRANVKTAGRHTQQYTLVLLCHQARPRSHNGRHLPPSIEHTQGLSISDASIAVKTPSKKRIIIPARGNRVFRLRVLRRSPKDKCNLCRCHPSYTNHTIMSARPS